MRIVFISPYYAPAWAYGGPPRVLSIIAGELVKKGHSVSVITTDVLDLQRNNRLVESVNGVRVHRFRTISNILAFRQKIFYVPNLLKKSGKIIDPADIVLFSDVRAILNWQIFGYILKKHIPYGIFAFGQIPYDRGWKSWIKKLFDQLWVSRFIQNAAWRFAQTEHEQSMYRRYFHIPRKAIQLLFLPIRIPKKDSMLKNKEDYFSQFGIQSKHRIVLFVGRLHYLKGVDILIKAMIPLLLSDQRLKLVIIGRDDGMEQELRSMVPSRLVSSVLFVGALYGDKAIDWYKRSSCFAITSRFYEETSTAALEALSFGCPVVTVHQSEIPYLSEYNAGITAINSISAIQKAIQVVLKNRNVMGKRAIQLIHDHYESDTVVSKLLSYIYPSQSEL